MVFTFCRLESASCSRTLDRSCAMPWATVTMAGKALLHVLPCNQDAVLQYSMQSINFTSLQPYSRHATLQPEKVVASGLSLTGLIGRASSMSV